MSRILKLFAPYLGINLEQVREEIPPIICLTNPVHFKLNFAIIVVHVLHDYFRAELIVKRGGRNLIDSYYYSVKGAKIAFHKRFRLKALRENIIPQWSESYIPSKEWLDKIM
jgi:hypothetical protein